MLTFESIDLNTSRILAGRLSDTFPERRKTLWRVRLVDNDWFSGYDLHAALFG